MRPALGAFLAPLLLAGCGDPEPAPASRPEWEGVVVEGIPDASDLCVAGEELLVCSPRARALFAIPRGAIEPGIVARAREVPVQVSGDPFLGGSDELASRGYRVSDLWPQETDFQGLAFQAPDLFWLGDRRYRVVYSGLLRRDGAGRWTDAVVQRAFAAPGADRPAREALDWRDASPGLAGLCLAGKDDLLVAERAGRVPGEFRLLSLDRFGPAMWSVTASLPAGGIADLGGVAPQDAEFLVLNGAGPGTLHRVPRGRRGEPVEVGPGEPLPVVAGAGPWRGIARAEDGTIYLVSSGPGTVLARRRPEPAR